MKLNQLRHFLTTNIFTISDVSKLFPAEHKQNIKTQLGRFVQNNKLVRLKRGLYTFKSTDIDEFEIANHLYRPSYISLETALNYYGIIPDVPQSVTSVTNGVPKLFTLSRMTYAYHKIKDVLFFGYIRKKTSGHSIPLVIARKEKALLDYFYIRHLTSTDDLRLDIGELDRELFQNYQKEFPRWIQRIAL